eukprot:TRINITY_DN73854_c0_g1_i1.p1 TRINITY_DN73854_c0_g1~~TRINITY_DN73854_c0_g1_i1.p1  ORF type:complete len:241 (-),score=13.41 TRINITY_DN73854_c0_g1_i1:73-795(-)
MARACSFLMPSFVLLISFPARTAACGATCTACQNVSAKCTELALGSGESRELCSSLAPGGVADSITVDFAASALQLGSACGVFDLTVGLQGADSPTWKQENITCREQMRLKLDGGNHDTQACATFTCSSSNGGACILSYSVEWSRTTDAATIATIFAVSFVAGAVYVIQHIVFFYLLFRRDLWGRYKRDELSKGYQCCLLVSLFCPIIEAAIIVGCMLLEQLLEDALGSCCNRKKQRYPQ